MKNRLLMKKILFFLILILMMACTTQNVLAADGTENIDTEDMVDNLPDSAKEILGDISVSENMDTVSIFEKLGRNTSDLLPNIMRDCVKNAILVVIVAMLCSLAGIFAKPKEGALDCITLVGVLAICTLCISGSGSIVGMASETTEDLYAFSNALLPTLASAAAAGGAVTSATVKFAATTLFLDVLISVGDNIIKPLIYAYLVASAASAAFSGSGLRSAAKLIKKIIFFSLCCICLAFTLYLAITGIIASSADAATVKLTKTAISTLLPVVGGMISDAAETIISGVGILKNAIGVFGIIAVCAVCLVPFLRLIAGSLTFKAASALSETVANSEIASLISAVGDAYSMALALCGTTAVILFVSIISAMKAVI